jgi:hypothetical protein
MEAHDIGLHSAHTVGHAISAHPGIHHSVIEVMRV